MKIDKYRQKICVVCKNVFNKRTYESYPVFRLRKCCSRKCSAKLRWNKKGGK